MTTLPSEPEGTRQVGSGSYDRARASHLQRHVAEGFGADAGRYDRARPTYPADLVDRIIAASPGRDVLDVGCGTGISARLFQAAGCQVLGVDPDPRMAELARQGGTEVEIAKFEDWDPAGRTFDAVVAAQAWHWVEPVAGTAKAGAVLRPGGRLAVFWNAFDPPENLREAFGEVFRRVLPDSPSGGFWDRPAVDAYRAGCARVADVMRQTGAFGEPEEWLSYWERPYTRDGWWTWSQPPAASPGTPRPSRGNSSTASAPPSTRQAAPSPCPARRSPPPPPAWPLSGPEPLTSMFLA